MKYLCIFQSAVQTSQLQHTASKTPAARRGVIDQQPCSPLFQLGNSLFGTLPTSELEHPREHTPALLSKAARPEGPL